MSKDLSATSVWLIQGVGSHTKWPCNVRAEETRAGLLGLALDAVGLIGWA